MLRCVLACLSAAEKLGEGSAMWVRWVAGCLLSLRAVKSYLGGEGGPEACL
jgi:hypothetical protein